MLSQTFSQMRSVRVAWVWRTLGPYAIFSLLAAIVAPLIASRLGHIYVDDVRETILILMIVSAVFLVVFLAVLLIWRINFGYRLTDMGIEIRYGFLSRPKYLIEYGQITDINLDKAGFDDLFGLRTLRIKFRGQAQHQSKGWLDRVFNYEIDRSVVPNKITLDGILRRQLGMDRLFSVDSGVITIGGLLAPEAELLQQALIDKRSDEPVSADFHERMTKARINEAIAFAAVTIILYILVESIDYAVSLLSR